MACFKNILKEKKCYDIFNYNKPTTFSIVDILKDLKIRVIRNSIDNKTIAEDQNLWDEAKVPATVCNQPQTTQSACLKFTCLNFTKDGSWALQKSFFNIFSCQSTCFQEH